MDSNNETVECDSCGRIYSREESTLCPECNFDNKEKFDDLYGEVD